MPFGGSKKILVIEGDVKAEHEPYIIALTNAPDFSTIILRVSVDARTKVGKLIKSKAKVLDFNLPSAWKQDELSRYIQREGSEIGLNLPIAVANYLAEAIGEDSYRIHNELEKIKLFKGSEKVTPRDIKDLVPNLNQNAIALADAIRSGDRAKTMKLTNDLLARGEHPLKITATLLTMFRRWLIVTTAKNVSDADLAKRCNLTNAKRLYYLRQEASAIGYKRLSAIVIQLFEIDCGLKRGLTEDEFVLKLLAL